MVFSMLLKLNLSLSLSRSRSLSRFILLSQFSLTSIKTLNKNSLISLFYCYWLSLFNEASDLSTFLLFEEKNNSLFTSETFKI